MKSGPNVSSRAMPTVTSNPPTGTIVAVGQFATALGSGFREIDVNPLIVGADGKGGVRRRRPPRH